MPEILNIYSDKSRLATVFAHKADAEQYLMSWLSECFATGGNPNDLPKLVEVKKRIGGQTWTVWLVAFSD